MIDLDRYPRISEQPTYRIHEIAHRCALGKAPHHFDACDGYCVNLLVVSDSVGRSQRRFEVYVDSSSDPATDCLQTTDRATVESFVRWLEEKGWDDYPPRIDLVRTESLPPPNSRQGYLPWAEWKG